MVTEHRPRTSLTRTDVKTSAGLELLELLQNISADGQLVPAEVETLHAWVDRNENSELAGGSHLRTVIHEILKDGVITDDELGVLHDAVLRVLPIELRSIATMRRREHKAAVRQEARRQNENERSRQREERERRRPMARGDFMVAGVTFNDRQSVCESCYEGDEVLLVREPDNAYDANAIIVQDSAGDVLGYVPRDLAEFYAPLMDEGVQQAFTVKKVIETSSGRVIPVVWGAFHRPEASLDAGGTSLVGVSRTAGAPEAAAPPSISPAAVNPTTTSSSPTLPVVHPARRGWVHPKEFWIVVLVLLAIILTGILITR